MTIPKYRVYDYITQKISPVASIDFGDDGSASTVIVEPAPKERLSRGMFINELAVLMKTVGIKDKNGIDIFEGDILKFKMNLVGSENKYHYAFIDFDDRDSSYYLYFNVEKTSYTGTINLYNFSTMEAEVMGDRFTNPLLLKNNN